MASLDAIGLNEFQLRERLPQRPSKPQQAKSPEAAKEAVTELNSAEENQTDQKEKRTYGRTPDGTGT
jgi:hypothetical protein